MHFVCKKLKSEYISRIVHYTSLQKNYWNVKLLTLIHLLHCIVQWAYTLLHSYINKNTYYLISRPGTNGAKVLENLEFMLV